MLVDLSIPELKQYSGRNPRPADFDAFWDRSLVELAAIDPDVELVPAKFKVPGAECFDLYFTGTGGCRIHCKYLRPAGVAEAKRPGVVCFHGYACSSGDWAGYLMYVLAGMEVLAMDCRGQGGSSEDLIPVRGNTYKGQIIRGLDEDDPAKLYFRNVFLDAARTVKVLAAMDSVDAGRIGVTGLSQGGGLTFAAASLAEEVKFAFGIFPFLCDYQRVWEMDLARDAYQELKDYFRLFDPRHERETEIFTKLGYIDVQHLAPRIKGEVLMATGLMDTVCPPSTQFAMYNRITTKKDVIFYPDFSHEGLPEISDFQVMKMVEVL